jgi:beta-glucosidase
VANLKRAHRAAYAALHEVLPRAQVGLAHHLRPAVPKSRRSVGDRLAAAFLDRAFNRLFLDLPQDWLGVNYYTRDLVRFAPSRPKDLFLDRSVPDGVEKNDLGWELFPEGLGLVLRSLAPKRLPIYLTENGIADAADSRRTRYLETHLGEVLRALADGVDVRGYLHWSLLDNFEWAEGYAPRFGLYAVDFATQARTLRKSGERYAEIIRSRSLE